VSSPRTPIGGMKCPCGRFPGSARHFQLGRMPHENTAAAWPADNLLHSEQPQRSALVKHPMRSLVASLSNSSLIVVSFVQRNRELCITSAGPFRQKQNLESRAKNARCIGTLTFILSLTGRGEEIPGQVTQSSQRNTAEIHGGVFHIDPSRKPRCADFASSLFHWVQGSPLPLTAQVIIPRRCPR
jgi:hypothetical protein